MVDIGDGMRWEEGGWAQGEERERERERGGGSVFAGSPVTWTWGPPWSEPGLSLERVGIFILYGRQL